MKYKRMSSSKQRELQTAALLLRYRTSEPSITSHKFLSFRRIAATLNLTHAEVEYICRKALKTPAPLSDYKRVRKLD